VEIPRKQSATKTGLGSTLGPEKQESDWEQSDRSRGITNDQVNCQNSRSISRNTLTPQLVPLQANFGPLSTP
jgi:hypothetical protein